MNKAPPILADMAHVIADRACVVDIETDGITTRIDGLRWYDVRPMTDPREVCDDSIEMNTQALAYAELRGLFHRHPVHPYLVRINPEHTP